MSRDREVESRPAERGDAVPRAARLERALARVRWFGVLLAFYQVWASYRAPADAPPGHVRPVGYALTAGLLLLNVVVVAALRRAPGDRAVRRLGWYVFACDGAVVASLTWLYSFDLNSTTWVTLYVLGLEGALRGELRGAMLPVAVVLPLEILRDVYRESAFEFPFVISSPLFRVGMMAIIAAVAGIMARDLQRERRDAEDRARELSAFHDIVLSGAAARTVDETLDRIVTTMAGELGYESFAILLLEDVDGAPALRCAGAYGFPRSAIGRTIRVDEGVCGRALARQAPELIVDTSTDPDYLEIMPSRSEMAVPILGPDGPIGVVDVESPTLGHYGPVDLERLVRLAPQIGLIISNARLLAGERATVERLRELDAMKSDFVAIASHELRTPLTAVGGFIKTLRRPELPKTKEQIAEFLEIADRQVDRLTRLVEDLLLASRIESGAVLLSVEEVDVECCIAETVEALGPGRRRVHTAVERNLPPILSDGQRVGQVVRNLLDNALKFSDPSAAVRLTAVGGDEEVVIEISDSGAGIPPDEVESIFDRFHQVGGARERAVGTGVGLGLYISRRLVEALGGTIEVSSEVGHGTSFRVRLPVRPARPGAAVSFAPQSLGESSSG